MLLIHKMTSDEANDGNTSSQYFCICPTHIHKGGITLNIPVHWMTSGCREIK